MIDYCFEQSCNGNRICINKESSFICNCNLGYTGIDCGINIDDCEDENCSGNGRCIDEVNSYRCECAPGFSGSNCETNIDECDGQNCSGEGLCIWMESTRTLVYVLLGILVLIAAQTLTIVSFRIAMEIVNVWMGSIHIPVSAILDLQV